MSEPKGKWWEECECARTAPTYPVFRRDLHLPGCHLHQPRFRIDVDHDAFFAAVMAEPDNLPDPSNCAPGLDGSERFMAHRAKE